MPATVLTGTRSTQTLSTETRRVRDVSPGIFKLEPDAAPLVAMLGRLRSESLEDPKIEWFEDELLPRYDILGADLTAGATTMTVTNYKYFRRNDLVQINDGEFVLVDAAVTSATVTIRRAFGTTGASAATSGQRLRIVSGADMEGNTSRAVISTQKSAQFNYAQIFKSPFQVTMTQKFTKAFGGNDLLEEQANMLIEHKKDIEQGILLAERNEDTSGTNPQRASRGLNPFITTHVLDAGGNLTELAFEGFLRRAFRFGSKQKVCLASSLVMTVINGWARGKLQLVPSDKSYGITLNQYMNAGRQLLLVQHPLLENDSLSDLTGFAGYSFVLDIGDLKLRYMRNKMIELQENIQANDSDTRLDQYISEMGLEAHQERKHAKLIGVTS